MGKVWSKANKDFSLIFLPFGNMQAIGKFLKKKKKVVTRVASNERRLKIEKIELDVFIDLYFVVFFAAHALVLII